MQIHRIERSDVPPELLVPDDELGCSFFYKKGGEFHAAEQREIGEGMSSIDGHRFAGYKEPFPDDVTDCVDVTHLCHGAWMTLIGLKHTDILATWDQALSKIDDVRQKTLYILKQLIPFKPKEYLKMDYDEWNKRFE